MHFTLIDRILERTDSTLIAIKHVSSAEEYLQDHFPGFPVLPGVMMLEAMTQAARSLVDHDNTAEQPWVLGQAKALKYGAFVRPGATIRITMNLHKRNDDGSIDFKGDVRLIEPETDSTNDLPVACSGRITLRPTTAGVHS
ncbi:MAG: polyketide synthase dehydratase domain-containing protein [Phycisphaerales bacterium]|nr:polyketide synthase dehydratase domain-containing protein [Phycisphaerales bacterium]